MNFLKLMKKPSAFLPPVISIAAFLLVIISVVYFGAVHKIDEGASAHLFQMLIALEVPIIVYFVIRWLPQTPKTALRVLLLQVCAILGALAPVFIFNL